MQPFGFLSRQIARLVLVAAIASAVAACKQDVPAHIALQQPRGATVAFDIIDGPPQQQFQVLVQKLNDEAQTRRLAVVSREGTSAYRVRGKLEASIDRGETTIGWTWDVFDGAQNRVLQIKGEEIAKERIKKVDEAWNVADEAMLRRIAQSSLDKLSAFLTSPDVVPAAAPAVAFNDSSPEAAGIYRLTGANADPLSSSAAAEAGKSGGLNLPLPGKDAGQRT